MEDDTKEQFNEAKKLLLSLRQQVELLESKQDQSVFLQTKISTNINSLSLLCNKLQTQLASVPASKRDMWTIQIDQLQSEYKTLRESIEEFFRRSHDSNKKLEQESQLHQRRNQQRAAQLEKEIFVSDSLSRTEQIANEISGMIGNFTVAFKDQNTTLKRIRRGVLDTVNQFELSRTVLHKMERHMAIDKIILFGGMSLVLLLLFLIWWFGR